MSRAGGDSSHVKSTIDGLYTAHVIGLVHEEISRLQVEHGAAETAINIRDGSQFKYPCNAEEEAIVCDAHTPSAKSLPISRFAASAGYLVGLRFASLFQREQVISSVSGSKILSRGLYEFIRRV